jgi:hypothetical protein
MQVTRALSVSDLQYPYYDKKVWAGVLKFAADFQPNVIVLNGDGHDFYDMSSHSRNPARVGRLAQEIEGFKDEILAPLEKLAPKAKKYYMEGNHEARFTRYIWHQAPAMSGLKGLKHAGEAMGVAEHGFEYRPGNDHLELGHLLVMHGHLVSRHSGWTARQHYQRYGTSLLIGHSHRWGTYAVRDWKSVHIAEEQGCLCDMNPEYDPHPNWQQGFATVHVFPDKYFDVQVVKVINRKLFIYGDKQWEL